MSKIWQGKSLGKRLSLPTGLEKWKKKRTPDLTKLTNLATIKRNIGPSVAPPSGDQHRDPVHNAVEIIGQETVTTTSKYWKTGQMTNPRLHKNLGLQIMQVYSQYVYCNPPAPEVLL